MPIEGLGLAKLAYPVIKDASKLVSKYVAAESGFMSDALIKHIVRAEKWSASINMLGMSKPAEVRGKSIALSITNQPRRFFKNSDPNAGVSEDVILETPKSIVVLGDPGSGKTTIIKRAIRKLIHESADDIASSFDFPLLVFGREISADAGLFQHLFDAIGFTIVKPKNESERREFDEWQANRHNHLKEAITTALLHAPIILFVDGLDEIDPSVRATFERDLQYLAETMSQGKVVATCRSGDWARPISDFEVFEISPLSDSQIREIAEVWAIEPAAFVNATTDIPYRDVLNRPLLLTLLILYFNQTGDLPEQPVDVYQRFVNVLISEWDEQRDVKRSTKFRDFLPARKFKFLADGAYELMIGFGTSRFDSRELTAALGKTAPRFGQSREEIKEIVRELEGHTGLLVESGFEKYEFCHLTVQEYLAAVHLNGMPAAHRDLPVVAVKSPATLAVAVSLSSIPSDFLGELFIELLTPSHALRHPVENIFLRPLLARLQLERPMLTPTVTLGVGVVLLLYSFDTGSILSSRIPEYQLMWPDIELLLSNPAVIASLELAIECYSFQRKRDDPRMVAVRFHDNLDTQFVRLAGAEVLISIERARYLQPLN